MSESFFYTVATIAFLIAFTWKGDDPIIPTRRILRATEIFIKGFGGVVLVPRLDATGFRLATGFIGATGLLGPAGEAFVFRYCFLRLSLAT